MNKFICELKLDNTGTIGLIMLHVKGVITFALQYNYLFCGTTNGIVNPISNFTRIINETTPQCLFSVFYPYLRVLKNSNFAKLDL